MIRVLSLPDTNPCLYFLFGIMKPLWLKLYLAAHEGVISVTISAVVGSGDKEIFQMHLTH